MHVSQLRQSRFLKKDDVFIDGRNGILVTISGVESVNVGTEHEPEDKFAITFVEDVKPMVLNTTNGNIIAEICGSEETDDWANHQIVLYWDKNVSFSGKLVGGVRARAPKQQAAPAQQRPAQAPRPVQPPPVNRPAPVQPQQPAPGEAPQADAPEDPDCPF